MKNTLLIYRDTSAKTLGYDLYNKEGDHLMGGDGYFSAEEIIDFINQLRETLGCPDFSMEVAEGAWI